MNAILMFFSLCLFFLFRLNLLILQFCAVDVIKLQSNTMGYLDILFFFFIEMPTENVRKKKALQRIALFYVSLFKFIGLILRFFFPIASVCAAKNAVSKWFAMKSVSLVRFVYILRLKSPITTSQRLKITVNATNSRMENYLMD